MTSTDSLAAVPNNDLFPGAHRRQGWRVTLRKSPTWGWELGAVGGKVLVCGSQVECQEDWEAHLIQHLHPPPPPDPFQAAQGLVQTNPARKVLLGHKPTLEDMCPWPLSANP